MNILLLGAGGFIGTNLAIILSKIEGNIVKAVDRKIDYCENIKKQNMPNVELVTASLDNDMQFDEILCNQDVVYHLVSTTVPTTSNQQIPQELSANVIFTSYLLEACIRCKVKKVIFISSGGTVYGKAINCPLNEDMLTYPISSYGIQKITIEKLLFLYNYLYGLDYKVIRLSNPYGPYQRPDGILGAVTTFTYKALKNEEIVVYGDGSVVRDYIYIDDAIEGILNIANRPSDYHTFNLGSGNGICINEVLQSIKKVLNVDLKVTYKKGRKVDVPVNYLDISRYEECFGKTNFISLEEGIRKTVDFFKDR